MSELATRRVRMLARLAFVWALLIVMRLVQLQVVQHSEYRREALQQQQQVVELDGPRGIIFDRWGQRLAMSLPVESVCVDPLRVPDRAMASEILAAILSLDARDLRFRMDAAARAKHGFLWVKRRVTPEEAKRLHDLQPKLEWIEFRTENQRFYPNKSLAAHVLGGVDFQQSGNGGVEQSLNDQLTGHTGEIRLVSDVRRHGFESTMSTQPQPGEDIKLTIDSRIQFTGEQEIKKIVEQHHAKSGSFVAMDPKTGDIIAMGNWPTYDPNEPPKPGAMVSRENLAVTAPFEPGSVYKVITLSAALETTNIRPETVIPCGNGSITLFGRTIHDHNRYGALSMEDVLARSSNIGAINIGLKVGPQNMYDYVRKFGFGRRTGVPLPGESPGMVRPLKRWEKSSIASVAMGHEIGVTALQLAQACSVIANGGFLVRPRLTLDTPSAQPIRVLKPETAITMRRMMEGVVIKPYGTGYKYARLLGYTSAGKTGTAQIYDYRAHQYTHLYNASFMGFAPVTNPAIVVVVTVNGTEGLAGYGGPTSAPAFREIAASALRIMDVPKDLPEMLPSIDGDLADENDVAIAGLGSSIPPPLVQAGDADAADDRPVASANSAPDQRNFSGPKVPNFQGKSLRDVIEQSAALGLPLEFSGDGIARGQIPAPGAVLPIGEKVRVQFGR